jgi:Zn-dependent metalloprotease
MTTLGSSIAAIRRAAPLLVALALGFAHGAAAGVTPLQADAGSRLSAKAGAPVSVGFQRATGAARFVRLQGAPEASLAPVAGSLDERARRFFRDEAAIFGLRDDRSELALVGEATDDAGYSHFTYHQFHRGVPVFAGVLRAHFDADGRLRAVNGTFVPGLELDVTARIEPTAARERAFDDVARRHPEAARSALSSGAPRLVVYRLGLDQGVEGASHLAWEIEVGNGGNVREFAYVEARHGKVIDVLPGVFDAMNRRAFLGTDTNGDSIPDTWPNSPDWEEGDPIPSGVQERDNMLLSTADVYGRFFGAFGRDSYDAAGHVLDQAYNRNYACPNASWNGNFISFCPGFTTHDVTAHEWGHAYTEYTHGLIYRWQSGALNESYSDIWGEAFDLRTTIAGMTDTDAPSTGRTAGSCTTFTLPPRVVITSPAPIAGEYGAGSADFGEQVVSTTAGEIVLAVDGDAGGDTDPNNGCSPLTNAGAIAGNIAFVNRGGTAPGGTCYFQVKAQNAFAAGAIGVIIGNIASSPTPTSPPLMGCPPEGCDPTLTIPTVSLNLADADLLRGQFGGATVLGEIEPDVTGTEDNSLRWLMGEDVSPGGALRDMWTPTCFGDPGKVTDQAQYKCATTDNGGVHSNSGVPNHAFALLADGGTYNSVVVPQIGMVKAIHAYYRAMTVYQVPASDFADHADALEASCDDLVTAGTSLADPWGGPPQVMTAGDCTAIAAAMDAVDMRVEPTFCNFTPMLDPNAPALCASGFQYDAALYDWEGGASGWTASRRDVANPASFDPRDWTIVTSLPDARPGSAFFAPDPNAGDCVADDETGVLVLESPILVMPATGLVPLFSFDHNVATEASFDGGNLKISVDGGPFTVLPPAAFTFNDYVGTLTVSQNTNPMAGEQAWHGADGGSNSGSWGRSIGDLAGIVAPGQTFQLRFELGTDGCAGTGLGWWVDDVRLYSCLADDALFLDNFETGDSSRWSSTAQ